RKIAKVGTWHWRTDTPFDALPANRDLLIEMESPFVLHMGFDGWKAVEYRSSARLPFGRHGVRLGKDELAGKRLLDFTRYFSRASKWEGNDYHRGIAPEQPRQERCGRGVENSHRERRVHGLARDLCPECTRLRNGAHTLDMSQMV